MAVAHYGMCVVMRAYVCVCVYACVRAHVRVWLRFNRGSLS